MTLTCSKWIRIVLVLVASQLVVSVLSFPSDASAAQGRESRTAQTPSVNQHAAPTTRRAVHSPGDVTLEGGVSTIYGVILGIRTEARLHLLQYLSTSLRVDGYAALPKPDFIMPVYLANLRGQVPIGANNNWELFLQGGAGFLQFLPEGSPFPLFQAEFGSRHVFQNGMSLAGALTGGGAPFQDGYILPTIGLSVTVGYDL